MGLLRTRVGMIDASTTRETLDPVDTAMAVGDGVQIARRTHRSGPGCVVGGLGLRPDERAERGVVIDRHVVHEQPVSLR